jgi:hypothetical protein
MQISKHFSRVFVYRNAHPDSENDWWLPEIHKLCNKILRDIPRLRVSHYHHFMICGVRGGGA